MQGQEAVRGQLPTLPEVNFPDIGEKAADLLQMLGGKLAAGVHGKSCLPDCTVEPFVDQAQGAQNSSHCIPIFGCNFHYCDPKILRERFNTTRLIRGALLGIQKGASRQKRFQIKTNDMW